MKLEALSCNQCGGPLSAPETANFVTCNHCSTQLAIRRTESATFTEQLGEIQSNQKQMMERLAQIERQNRLAQIDRDWERDRQKYMTTMKSGKQVEPNEVGAVVMGVIAAGIGLFWTIQAFSINSRMPSGMGSGFFPFFGVLFILFGIGAAIYGISQAKDYKAARRRYMRRRGDASSEPSSEAVRFAADQHIPTPEEYLDELGEEENV
jgi:hypothetical protein